MTDAPGAGLHAPTLQQIRDAQVRIRPYVRHTPLVELDVGLPDRRIYLKLETLQPIGAFKLRPALNAILSVLPIDDFVEEAIFRSTFRQERDTLEPVHREIIDCCATHEPERTVVPLVGADFYNRVRAAHTLVQTSEPRLYANVILRKGVIYP